MEKCCSRCGKVKAISEFHKTGGSRIHSWCKSCSKAERRRRYLLRKQTELSMNAKWRKSHRPLMRKYGREYAQRSLFQNAARVQVRLALKYGRLKRNPCEVCGNKKVEAHHDDYTKQLNVRWLCKNHHEEVHHGVA